MLAFSAAILASESFFASGKGRGVRGVEGLAGLGKLSGLCGVLAVLRFLSAASWETRLEERGIALVEG